MKFCTICIVVISELGLIFLCVEWTFHLVAIWRKGDVLNENITQGWKKRGATASTIQLAGHLHKLDLLSP